MLNETVPNPMPQSAAKVHKIGMRLRRPPLHGHPPLDIGPVLGATGTRKPDSLKIRGSPTDAKYRREAVPHGRRATRTRVDDTRPEDAEATEKALAHEGRNRVAGCLSPQRPPRPTSPSRPCEGTAPKITRTDKR